MSGDNYTIKVNFDFDKKKIKELQEDVKKAVKIGSQEGFSSAESVRSTIQKKISEIESAASSSIYKYGTNHLKTRSTVSDLHKAQKSLFDLDASKTRAETVKKLSDSKIRQQGMREEGQSIRLGKQKDSQQKQKLSDLFRNVKLISSSSLATSRGVVSLVSKMGPVGVAIGAGAAAAFGIGKALKWASNKSIGYSSGSMGSGYSAAEIAALSSGQVRNMNSDIGKNIANSIQDNKLSLSQGNMFRSAQLAQRAIMATAQFGTTGSVGNLIGVGSGVNQKQIYSRLFGDIKSMLNQGKTSSALSLGRSFGLSDETILAIKTFNSNINKNIEASGKGSFSSFNNTSTSALKASSSIDNLTGKINLLASAIVNITGHLANSPLRGSLGGFDLIGNNSSGIGAMSSYSIAPGNSPKGNR